MLYHTDSKCFVAKTKSAVLKETTSEPVLWDKPLGIKVGIFWNDRKDNTAAINTCLVQARTTPVTP